MSENRVLGMGKLPARVDRRTLKAMDYALEMAVPASYTFRRNELFKPIDQGDHGDCTIVAAAGVQQRFEFAERHRLTVPRRDREGELADLLAAYRKIMVGDDQGAYALDALKLWQDDGVALGVRDPKPWRIAAYAAIGRSPEELKRAIWNYKLAYVGLMVTTDMATAEDGELVTAVNGRVLGGHMLACTGYDEVGLFCAPSWAHFRPHHLSWAYLARHLDEAYAVTDAKNTLGAHIDMDNLAKDVRRVRGGK